MEVEKDCIKYEAYIWIIKYGDKDSRNKTLF